MYLQQVNSPSLLSALPTLIICLLCIGLTFPNKIPFRLSVISYSRSRTVMSIFSVTICGQYSQNVTWECIISKERCSALAHEVFLNTLNILHSMSSHFIYFKYLYDNKQLNGLCRWNIPQIQHISPSNIFFYLITIMLD